VHRGYGEHLDVSADLLALARFPVAVISSGVKSLLDVVSTREALESLGVPVVGYQTDSFPAFYLRKSAASVDIRIDDVKSLAAFALAELQRTGRGILIVQPVPEEEELDAKDWGRWLLKAEAEAEREGARGRDATPAILGALHRISEGRTLQANLALIRENTRLAARLAAASIPLR
jgi:pseudouridine-5'-phosphate glycosidase